VKMAGMASTMLTVCLVGIGSIWYLLSWFGTPIFWTHQCVFYLFSGSCISNWFGGNLL